ncbi:MAG: hypothetical protein ACTSQP_22030 [Promethearchaeota archaeon]
MGNLEPLQIHSYIILKLLNAKNKEPIKTRILFQKIAFLILRKYKELFELVDFKSNKFGPHSASLGETLEELKTLEYVSEDRESGIKITNRGEGFLKELEKSFKSKEIKKLEEFENSVEFIKKEFNNFSKDDILAFIYKESPEYISNSIISDKIDYKKQFLKLYEEGKLGISKIAELLKCSYDDIYEYIKSRGKLMLL